MPMYENPFCGRCNQRVYMAEERLGAGQSWHKVGCYTCKVCNVTLNSTTLAEANEG